MSLPGTKQDQLTLSPDQEEHVALKQPLLEPTFGESDHYNRSALKRVSSAGSELSDTPPLKAKIGNTRLFLYGLLLLCTSVGNSIFFKKMTNAFPNYPYFLSQTTSVVYLPIFWGAVLYEYLYTDLITTEMWKFPIRKFSVMGFLDASAGIFMLFGGVHTDGSTQALLAQMVIPLTMFLAYIILSERYHQFQYIGAAVIIGGLLFVLVPPQINPPPSSGSDGGNEVAFNMIFLMGNIPQGFSSIYKELAFTTDMDINLLQAWVATWQVVFGFMFMPVNSLKFLGANYMPMSAIPDSLSNGFKCLMGINTIVTACGGDLAKSCDDCGKAWIPLFLYMLFNVAYNVATVLVLKHAGANLLYFIMTIKLPLLQLAFTLPFIIQPTDKFYWYDGVGLAFILTGLVLYRWKSMQGGEGDGPDQQHLPHFSMWGIEASTVTMYAKDHTVRRQNPQRIRSGFYARLGIASSPDSPFIRESFRSRNFASSPGWKKDLEEQSLE